MSVVNVHTAQAVLCGTCLLCGYYYCKAFFLCVSSIGCAVAYQVPGTVFVCILPSRCCC